MLALAMDGPHIHGEHDGLAGSVAASPFAAYVAPPSATAERDCNGARPVARRGVWIPRYLRLCSSDDNILADDCRLGREVDGVPTGLIETVWHSSLQGKNERGWEPSQQMEGGWNATFAILVSFSH